MDTALLIELISIGIEKGPDILIKICRSLENDHPTVEEIRALKVKDPEEYA